MFLNFARNFGTSFFTLALLIVVSPVLAVPTLQLDIDNGTFDSSTETVISSGSLFTLHALLRPDAVSTLDSTYYISAALMPKTSAAGNYGSFEFAGQTIDVTGDMDFGVPPVESFILHDGGDLGDHDIFDTYYKEFSFTFAAANKALEYNVQDTDSASLTPDANGALHYSNFLVDTSNLAGGYQVHFDLYQKGPGNIKKYPNDIDILAFAPFSHDAQSGDGGGGGNPVPEPATLVLMALGLGGVSLTRKFTGKKIRN